MTEITTEKKKLLAIYAKKYCSLNNPSLCTKKPCTCAVAAEYRAFINKTIPIDFRDFTIFDFDGKLKGEDFKLAASVAANAKCLVWDFCWGKSKLINKLSVLDTNSRDALLDKESIIGYRISRGQNVIIHGESPKNVIEEGDGKTHQVRAKPLGRTFIASLITKEVIKTRLDNRYPNLRIANYEWIGFSLLRDSILNGSDDMVHLESCEWLVVDDIPEESIGSSQQQKAYVQPKIDAFFSSRLRSQHSTLLVFRFDADRRISDIESTFGVSVAKIINDKRTCVIRLTQPT